MQARLPLQALCEKLGLRLLPRPLRPRPTSLQWLLPHPHPKMSNLNILLLNHPLHPLVGVANPLCALGASIRGVVKISKLRPLLPQEQYRNSSSKTVIVVRLCRIGVVLSHALLCLIWDPLLWSRQVPRPHLRLRRIRLPLLIGLNRPHPRLLIQCKALMLRWDFKIF